MFAGSTGTPVGLSVPSDTQYGLKLPVGPSVVLLLPPGLRDNNVPPVVMPISFSVAEAIVLFGIFKDGDSTLVVLFASANGCRNGVVSPPETVELVLLTPVPFCCWVVPAGFAPSASSMRRKLCRLCGDSNAPFSLIGSRSESIRRCKGMVMDGVDRMPDGASMPAVNGGMTGPRGRRPSELIKECVYFPAKDNALAFQ